MQLALYCGAVVAGGICLFVYFRSVVVVMLIDRRGVDVVETSARYLSVRIVHLIVRRIYDYEGLKQATRWILPLFILLSVVAWFLLVQVAFTLILWGARIEPDWWRAVSASGSALSTLGFLTPSNLAGEYLAIFEAAIGLAIVILIFTFVPGYQSAIQIRERLVERLDVRTGSDLSPVGLLQSLQRANKLGDLDGVWDEWELWFLNLKESHVVAPILAYVPSLRSHETWLRAAASFLDTASLFTACVEGRNTEAARVCREVGTETLRLLALAIGPPRSEFAIAGSGDSPGATRFDGLYDTLAQLGLPVRDDREACRSTFDSMRARYSANVELIARATLTRIG